MDQQNYKVVKNEKPVEILMDAASPKPLKGLVFLNRYSRFGNREESLDELLNNSAGFIPVRIAESGDTELINVREILYVHEKDTTSMELIQKKVELTFVNQMALVVDHFQAESDSRSRVIDYLNSDDRFLYFIYGGRKILINKEKIMRSCDNEPDQA